MTECDIPGCDGGTSIPFTCNECGGTYCSDHRLPEKHLCSQLRSTNKNLDDLFATGLQDKPGKKRGMTKRTSETGSTPDTPDPSPTYPGENISKTTTQKSATADGQNSSVDPVNLAGSVIFRLYETIYSFVWSAWLLGNRKFKTAIRVVGISLVVVGGIRLLSNSPINAQPVPWIREVAAYLHGLPDVGWITYIFVGLVVFYVANYRWLTLAKVATAIVVISVLLVGFTPIGVSDGTPGIIRDPIEDSAEFAAGAVGNITDSTDRETPTNTGNDINSQTETSSDSTESGLERQRIEKLIHEQINERREERNLRSLSFDTQLREIARYHSQDMADEDYFDHTSPSGETREDRYDRFGYDCRVSTGGNSYATGAENINRIEYSGFSYTESEIAEKFVTSWMESDGHRENILKQYWENEGIGVVVHEDVGDTVVIATQNFC